MLKLVYTKFKKESSELFVNTQKKFSAKPKTFFDKMECNSVT